MAVQDARVVQLPQRIQRCPLGRCGPMAHIRGLVQRAARPCCFRRAAPLTATNTLSSRMSAPSNTGMQRPCSACRHSYMRTCSATRNDRADEITFLERHQLVHCVRLYVAFTRVILASLSLRWECCERTSLGTCSADTGC